MDQRLLAFMQAFPQAKVSASGPGDDPWAIGRYHGPLMPGMNDWLAQNGLKWVYDWGSYQIVGLTDPRKQT